MDNSHPSLDRKNDSTFSCHSFPGRQTEILLSLRCPDGSELKLIIYMQA